MIELLISILGTLCAAGIKIACEQYFKRRYEDEIREEVDGWYSYLPGFLRKKRGARYVRLRKQKGVLDSDSDDEEDRSQGKDNELSDDESSLSSITTDSSSQDNWKDPEESVSEMDNENSSRDSGINGDDGRGDDGNGGSDSRNDDSESVDGDSDSVDGDDSETHSLLTSTKNITKSITVAITHPESVYYDTKSSSYSNT